MKSIDHWLEEYGESHQNPTNKKIHWICVPLIVFSLAGMLWSIPHAYFGGILPAAVDPFFNWATLFLLFALGYYFILSKAIFLGFIPVIAVVLAGNFAILRAGLPLFWVSLAVFVLAWIGQFIGHQIEGKKPSFFKDLQFLLIGPAWLMHFVFRRVGIGY